MRAKQANKITNETELARAVKKNREKGREREEEKLLERIMKIFYNK